jgi:alkylation response protein AidB-like acyl-CoA dehydrogenase
MSVTLDRARDLAPMIAAQSAAIEAERRVPASLIAALREAGIFRMYVPRTHGGDELSSLEVVQVIEELSRADASVGWVSTIGANSPAIFALLPPTTYDAIYANGPDVIQAGSLVPRGRAIPVAGGYRFTGQWPFASGCDHADYCMFAAFVEQDGDPAVGGRPEVRFGVVPAGVVEILDTWYVSGLKGTSSHDIVATELFVDADWTASFFAPAPVVRHPLDRVRPLGRLGLELAAVAVGTAQAALEDLIEIATTKKPLGGLLKRLAEEPVFQHTVGGLDADVRTARTLLHETATRDYQRATAGEDLDQRALLERLTALKRVGEIATAVVDRAYHEAGTTGLFESSPLQRRLRDIHAVVQHVVFTSDSFTPAGATLLGEPASGILF